MSLFHKHLWLNVGYDYVWVYPYTEKIINIDGRFATGDWDELEVSRKDNPGRQELESLGKIVGYRYPLPYTIIQQKCDCGKYRSQRVEGILEGEK